MRRNRRIRSAIRKILLEVWDPIGIRDEPNAQDEYDFYADEVYELLTANAPDKKIARYLIWVMTERMGFTKPPEEWMSPTVCALRRLLLRT
jgi:hypothetical protein